MRVPLAVSYTLGTRRLAVLAGWLQGAFVFFSDYGFLMRENVSNVAGGVCLRQMFVGALSFFVWLVFCFVLFFATPHGI